MAAAGIGAALTGGAWLLYSKTPGQGFGHAIADHLLLPGALLVFAAFGVEFLAKRINDRRAEVEQNRVKRLEFLHRLRAAHVRCAIMQKLMYVDRSSETYKQQLHELIRLTPEVEDIEADMSATGSLFQQDKTMIVKGIQAIVAFLDEGYDEFVKFNQGKSEGGLGWLDELLKCPVHFPESYDEALRNSKGIVRWRVFGDGPPPKTTSTERCPPDCWTRSTA